ncbi:hypothetical protein NC652_023618 [Populus alba x Populus x berolinensis]|nr:hypothetical protein NC652_023618 [Populus alba x Populus x berolinensis]
MASDSRLPELVDPRIRDSFDMDQLQTIATIVRWCTQRVGRARPSIKQVLRLLYVEFRTQCIAGLCGLWKMKSVKEVKDEEERAGENHTRVMLFSTVGMERYLAILFKHIEVVL